MKTRRRLKSQSPAVLVFGEDANDIAAISELIRAIRPDAPSIKPIRDPVILRSNIREVKKADFANRLRRAVSASRVINQVVSVVAHRDCDEIEPANAKNAAELKAMLHSIDSPQPVAVTPAFELEAWWYLWPEAVASVRKCWRSISHRSGTEVGKIIDAKEALRRDLRPKKNSTCPDYRESDSVTIARNVREMKCVAMRTAKSDSFDRFYNDIIAVKF